MTKKTKIYFTLTIVFSLITLGILITSLFDQSNDLVLYIGLIFAGISFIFKTFLSKENAKTSQTNGSISQGLVLAVGIFLLLLGVVLSIVTIIKGI